MILIYYNENYYFQIELDRGRKYYYQYDEDKENYEDKDV